VPNLVTDSADPRQDPLLENFRHLVRPLTDTQLSLTALARILYLIGWDKSAGTFAAEDIAVMEELEKRSTEF